MNNYSKWPEDLEDMQWHRGKNMPNNTSLPPKKEEPIGPPQNLISDFIYHIINILDSRATHINMAPK